MKDLYLILHKVHGYAAFDIATKCALDGKEWYVVAGARAYPVKTWPLEALTLEPKPTDPLDFPRPCDFEYDVSTWTSIQDFYEVPPADWSKMRKADLDRAAAAIDERAEEKRERLDFLSSLAPAAPAVSIITRRLKA